MNIWLFVTFAILLLMLLIFGVFVTMSFVNKIHEIQEDILSILKKEEDSK